MGYNQGDTYEQKIFDILQHKQLIAPNTKRAGAGNSADLQFFYKNQPHNLEIKLDLKADYGQKMLKWQNDTWFWSKNDSITQMYTDIGILNTVNQKRIPPNRFTVPKSEITLHHKRQDQQIFEDIIAIPIPALYNFYAEKNCYYIQVGGFGFYHLQQDILSLGTPQFTCKLNLRLRAKTIHSKPIYNYGFYAVLKIGDRPPPSPYDLEEKEGRSFPPL